MSSSGRALPGHSEKLFWDGKYVGQLEEDRREGHGVMHYFTGEVYEGEWKTDKWSGEGVYTWKNGDKYFGSFKGMPVKSVY